MIDHERKFIFIHIARTGGTSIESALVGNDWWKMEPSTKHISAKQARNHYGEETWNNYVKFTVVRNPWDRIISMWATKWWHEAANLNQDCSIEEFILNIKPHPNEIYDSLFYHEILNEKLDFVLRFESLKEDFDEMIQRVNGERIDLPHIQKRERKKYTEMYGEKEKQLVSEIFEKDISLFGYQF